MSGRGTKCKRCLTYPLNPKSDQHQISPCINRVVMRITDMITKDVFA